MVEMKEQEIVSGRLHAQFFAVMENKGMGIYLQKGERLYEFKRYK